MLTHITRSPDVRPCAVPVPPWNGKGALGWNRLAMGPRRRRGDSGENGRCAGGRKGCVCVRRRPCREGRRRPRPGRRRISLERCRHRDRSRREPLDAQVGQTGTRGMRRCMWDEVKPQGRRRFVRPGVGRAASLQQCELGKDDGEADEKNESRTYAHGREYRPAASNRQPDREQRQATGRDYCPDLLSKHGETSIRREG